MLPLYITGTSVIGPDHAWLWYCIPKNASRSLLRLFTDAGGTPLRVMGRDARTQIERWSPRYSFAFVRHPEARVISAWRNKVLSPPKTPAQAKLLARSPGLEAGMALNDFVEWLGEAMQRGPVDKHWRPQRDYVCDKSGKIVPDFVGKIERLDADLLEVSTRIGKLQAIPHLNPTKPSPDEALSSRSRSKLSDLYRSDFELFGYEPGA